MVSGGSLTLRVGVPLGNLAEYRSRGLLSTIRDLLIEYEKPYSGLGRSRTQIFCGNRYSYSER